MRLACFVVVAALVAVACAENRQKRQAQQQAAQYYPAQQAQTQQPRYVQPSQQQYQPSSQYQQGQQYSQYDYQQQQQAQPARRPAASTRQAAPATRKSFGTQASQEEEEEEEEQKPSPLELLLERSTFKCDQKKDGYYADTSVECKAFHYCIGGAKNSFMCAEGTVFHQVHLNCVPADQDICGSSEKYYFVNDYLNKELEQRGPNNTILYADRYYPEGYVVGDPIPAAPQSAPPARAPAFAQGGYDDEPRPRPAQRPPQRAAAPAGVTYRQASVQPALQANYRQAAAAAPAGVTYRQAQAQPAQAYDPYAQYRGGGQQQPAGQNPYYRAPAASNPQAQYDQSSEERGVKYDDE